MDRLEAISITVHEAVRAWAMAHGQADIPSWDEAPDWMHASTRESVEHAISNPGSGGQGQHDQWLQQKQRDGWQYGALKDAEAKTHPLLVPYDELPEFEKSKDALVQSIVAALAGQ